MPVFYSERKVTEHLNRWLHDECEHGDVEFDFSLPIEQKQVKARLAQLYKEQQHAGERHGLQKGQRQNATTWHIMPEFSVLRHGSDGDRFERELRKIMFNVIDTGTDPPRQRWR